MTDAELVGRVKAKGRELQKELEDASKTGIIFTCIGYPLSEEKENGRTIKQSDWAVQITARREIPL